MPRKPDPERIYLARRAATFRRLADHEHLGELDRRPTPETGTPSVGRGTGMVPDVCQNDSTATLTSTSVGKGGGAGRLSSHAASIRRWYS